MKTRIYWLYVFDYATGTIHEIKVKDETERIDVNVDEILEPYGMRESDCCYMITEQRVSITKHKGAYILKDND
jgi:hypothetical protein